jgi:TPR repeat protein
MEQGFIDILKQVAKEQGKESFLETKKCKAIVSDYTKADYKNEKSLLLRAVEAGVPKAIITAEKADIDSCMKAQQRVLQEEEFMDNAIAWNIVFVIAYVLRDITIKEIKTEGNSSDFDEAESLYYDDQFDKAIKIFEALAKAGHAGAQLYLGYIYRNGDGVEKDIDKSFEWIKKAADQGYARAQLWLGLFYSYGWGAPRDEAKAVEWIRKAAEQEDTLAQQNLAGFYAYGRGLPKDQAKALEWYRKAAEKGDDVAQVYLAECFEEGNGVEKSTIKAVKWYRKAAEQGNEYAQEKVKKLEDD